MSEDRLDRLEKIIESNAKAIEALANSITNDREQLKQQQKGLYEYLERIATAQSNFYYEQAGFYRHLEKMEERQAQIIEILKKMNTQLTINHEE